MGAQLTMPVTEGQSLKTGVRTVVGSIRIGDLVPRFEVARNDFFGRKGYQRPVTTSRVNKLAHDLSSGLVDLPTAILINFREFQPSWLVQDGDRLLLCIPSEVKLYVVDGQHRAAAAGRLFAAEPDNWADFRLQFVALLGADEQQEMRQFYVVNSTAKSVRTDLAYELLKRQAESSPDIMQNLIDSGERWKVDAQALVEKLGTESPLWKGKVRFPGESSDGTTINSSSMVNSIKGLQKHPYFGRLPIAQQAQVLEAYWLAIQRVIPDAFGEPDRFAIQKGVGAMVLHGIFPEVLAVIQSRNDSLIDPDAYVEVVKDSVLRLVGEAAEGEVVDGVDFWRSAPRGAAGAFSSSAGRRVLIARLSNGLPEPELR